MAQDTDQKEIQAKDQSIKTVSPKKTMAKPMVFGQWGGEPYNREEIKGILWQEWY